MCYRCVRHNVLQSTDVIPFHNGIVGKISEYCLFYKELRNMTPEYIKINVESYMSLKKMTRWFYISIIFTLYYIYFYIIFYYIPCIFMLYHIIIFMLYHKHFLVQLKVLISVYLIICLSACTLTFANILRLSKSSLQHVLY